MRELTVSMQVVIIGAGRIGQAFKYMCEKRATSVEFFDADSSKVPEQKPLTETIPDADVVFLCIQSFALREVIAHITPFLKSSALIVTVAKGIERDTHKTIDQVLQESLPAQTSWGIIVGPMLAEEIVQGQGSAGVFVGSNADNCTILTSLISAHDLSLECSDDLRGVALAGVLKNIYALGLGIADGLGWGANRKGWLITRAVREMREILQVLDGNPNTADGPAGLGDLIATGSSPHSRNRTTGQAIVTTGEINVLSEGYISIMSVKELLGTHTSEFPLFTVLLGIIVDKHDAREIFDRMV